MPVEIKVPSVGESVTEVTIDKWLFQEGDSVERDKTIAVLESEKATVELPAEASGRVARILKKRGETAAVGEVIAIIETDGAAPTKPKAEAKPAALKLRQRRKRRQRIIASLTRFPALG